MSRLMYVVINLNNNKRMTLCDDRCVCAHTYRCTSGEGVYWVYAVGDVLLFLSIFAIEMLTCAHLHATIIYTHTIAIVMSATKGCTRSTP